MALRTTSKWLAVSLYYGEPWEEFLVKAVKPYTDVVRQTGVAERFFFERSWNMGPHIQLWFKGNPYVLTNMLRPNLNEHFEQYFASRPSFVNPPKYPRAFPDKYKWHPNNSVQYSHYHPEQEYSGGQLELNLLEQQFEASSKLVLQSLREKSNRWTYSEMISTAIKIHVGFAYALGMDRGEAGHFFEFLFNNWYRSNSLNDDSERSNTVHSFHKIFNLQRKDTVPYHTALWQLLLDYEKMEDTQYVNWINVNADTSVDLNFALEQGKLPRKATNSPNGNYPKAWHYYESLVKSTNNRLGIFRKNEGYLFYIIAESLRTINQSEQSERERAYQKVGMR
jgi:hypothetical protein